MTHTHAHIYVCVCVWVGGTYSVIATVGGNGHGDLSSIPDMNPIILSPDMGR